MKKYCCAENMYSSDGCCGALAFRDEGLCKSHYIERIEKELSELKAKNERLIKALEFYGNERTWVKFNYMKDGVSLESWDGKTKIDDMETHPFREFEAQGCKFNITCPGKRAREVLRENEK